MLVPVSAARPSGDDLLQDTASVYAWNAWLESNMYVLPETLVGNHAFWNEFDHAIQASGAGACDRKDSLISARDNWNGSFSVIESVLIRLFSLLYTGSSARPRVEVAYDSNTGVDRLREVHTKLWIVNSSGHFPYYKPISGGGSGFTEGIGQWLPYDQAIASNQALWHTVIGADLSAYAESWPDRSSRITESEDYFYLVWNDPDQHRKAYVLCDDYGYPYYVPKPKQTAVTTPNNYYTEQGDSYTDDSTNVNVYDQGTAFLDSILDVENGILNVGGEAYYVDEINYDDSTKTYFVDSHDSYTWSPTYNTYITNNYKWEITYNIDYTSVTYIGQTEEYEERYEYYYELPDGRSSADLTAEDLEQLSVVFYDVMNYSRTADDSGLRALYHFDGNTEDSSYWSYTRHGFSWSIGASLTYMDEGTFGGSLYLDENEHVFNVHLPGNDLSGDWTLQFRYYQSYTETPTRDIALWAGGEAIFFMDGRSYFDKNGVKLGAQSIGTWNEICLMRKDGVLYYYVNGVCLGNATDDYHQSWFGFAFGSAQQTYKKIDELRVTNRAIYNPPSNYTPSVVPYDTNLSLVLPDATSAVADEIVTVNRSITNMLNSVSLADWSSVEDIGWKLSDYEPWSVDDNFSFGIPQGSIKDRILLFAEADYLSLTQGTSGIVFFPKTATSVIVRNDSNYSDRVLGNGFFLPVYEFYGSLSYIPSTKNAYAFGDPGKYYCFSVVLADGSYSHIVFDRDLNVISSLNNSSIVLSVNHLGGQFSESAFYRGGILARSQNGMTCEILYMELVEGTAPQFTIDVETVIYDSDELTEDPILAVRSNRPITNYQIGGVRPSYPEKGQVYAMVENNRITSLQQYTGFVWEAVDGRIWTGVRWIPYSSFDVKTLQDFWDVEGTSGDDYFYSESGFWSWFQRQWKIFMEKMDKVIYYMRESVGLPEESDCEHVYQSEETSPSCSMPGGTVYTCENCGYVLLESTPALGHDWVVIEDIPSEFNLPEDAHCPDCSTADFTYELNSTQDEFTCKCTSCGREWKETPDVTWGYTNSKCTRCGVTQTESKDPSDNGIFTALGNFLSDGIDWILDKLTQLVEAVSGIQATFKDFADRMKENVGQYPAFLAAAIAVLPGDFMDVIWFSVIALVAVLVYKKVTR